MRKMWIVLLVMCCVLLVGCSARETGGQSSANMPNPWTQSSAEEMASKLGTPVLLPEGAQNIVYRALSSEGLYEIDFDYNGLRYTYRLKKTDALEDISGLYYDWTVQQEEAIQGFPGMSSRMLGEQETVDLVSWYETGFGVTHSLSTAAADLDGFDILAITQMLIPAE